MISSEGREQEKCFIVMIDSLHENYRVHLLKTLEHVN